MVGVRLFFRLTREGGFGKGNIVITISGAFLLGHVGEEVGYLLFAHDTAKICFCHVVLYMIAFSYRKRRGREGVRE